MDVGVTVLALLFGVSVGSFLNVVITRVPRGESLLEPASHCRRCGRALCWWENVPLVSYVALSGRCRSCRAPIGVRYFLVELVTGLAAAAAAAAWLRPAGAARG